MVLFYADIVFVIVYLFEMVLKIFGFGPFDYIRDHWNKFDAAIVIISLVGIFLQAFSHSTFRSRACEGVAVVSLLILLHLCLNSYWCLYFRLCLCLWIRWYLCLRLCAVVFAFALTFFPYVRVCVDVYV